MKSKAIKWVITKCSVSGCYQREINLVSFFEDTTGKVNFLKTLNRYYFGILYVYSLRYQIFSIKFDQVDTSKTLSKFKPIFDLGSYRRCVACLKCVVVSI